MNVLLTGAGGFVGGSVLWHMPEDWTIHATVRKKVNYPKNNVRWHVLDLLDRKALMGVLRTSAPDVIIHCAASANIDWCEANAEKARALNVEVTRQLACFARERGSRFIFLSTDNVFDGKKGLYVETDRPNPINYYGWTKVWAEEAIEEIDCPYVIARVAFVVGLPLLGMGSSAMSRVLETLRKGKALEVPTHEIRSPIDVVTLGKALVELVSHPFQGKIHLAGDERLNRFDMMARLARCFGFDESLVRKNDPRGMPGRAERPDDVSLNNKKAKAILATPMLSFDEGLSRVLALQKSYTW